MNVQQEEYNDEVTEAVWILREEVLLRPIGISRNDAMFSKEEDDNTFVAKDNGRIVGCLMLRTLDNGRGKLRQMAVYPEFQRKGIGTALLQAAEAYALEEGMLFLELHAQERAVDFYRRCGYHPSGEPFMEAGISHTKMVKTLAG